MILEENAVYVVTGGNGLLGKAIIDEIASNGGIAISVDITHETDTNRRTIKADLTNSNEIKEVIRHIEENYGLISGWVNNAYPRTQDWGSDFLNLSEESLKKNVDWQLNSYILCCQSIISHMLVNKKGSIVNMASIYGIVGNDFTVYEGTNIIPPSPYSAIKGGLINFTRFVASRYGRDGIRVNCVSPGGIFDHQDKKFVEAYEKKVPLKRLGNPTDISPAVVFLLSNKSNYITGHNLVVDGGWTSI